MIHSNNVAKFKIFGNDVNKLIAVFSEKLTAVNLRGFA
jgi:hypothetical protein